MINEIEAMRPHIDVEADPRPGETPQAEEKVSDGAYNLDTIGQANEMEERLDALIEKKIKRLIIIREFQRQYCQDSSAKLIEHRAPTAKDVSSKLAVTKLAVTKPAATKVGHSARIKKTKSANDNWNENNNDDDYYSSDDNDAEYDELEYEETQAEKKARQERRARNG